MRQWRLKNKESVAAYAKAYHIENQESRAAGFAEWLAENRDRRNSQQAEYRRSNREKVRTANITWVLNNKEAAKAARSRYRKKTAALHASRQCEREAAKKQAIPPWADVDAIRVVYEEAHFIRDVSGEDYQVDHIVPLKSRLVCGLHVIDNLQIIPAKANAAKGNRWWPDMP